MSGCGGNGTCAIGIADKNCPNCVGRLSEEQLAKLREQDPNWAYNACCGEPFNCGGCIIDRMTGA